MNNEMIQAAANIELVRAKVHFYRNDCKDIDKFGFSFEVYYLTLC